MKRQSIGKRAIQAAGEALDLTADRAGEEALSVVNAQNDAKIDEINDLVEKSLID